MGQQHSESQKVYVNVYRFFKIKKLCHAATINLRGKACFKDDLNGFAMLDLRGVTPRRCGRRG